MKRAGNPLDISICAQQHSMEDKGNHLISGVLHRAPCLWALSCINEKSAWIRAGCHMHFVCAFKWRCMQPHVLEQERRKKTTSTVHVESLSSWDLGGSKANAPPNIWARLDISSLCELELTPFKMSEHGNSWRTCEWVRMTEN